MAHTDDLTCHYLRIATRNIRLAREALDSGERLRHLQVGLALVNDARQLIDRMVVGAANSVASIPGGDAGGVPSTVPDDLTTMVEYVVDAQDKAYGHG